MREGKERHCREREKRTKKKERKGTFNAEKEEEEVMYRMMK